LVLLIELGYVGLSFSGTGGDIDSRFSLGAVRRFRRQKKRRTHNPTTTMTTGIMAIPIFVAVGMPRLVGVADAAAVFVFGAMLSF
jgi:hypothetical protein